jgi:hypothetical protein
MGIIQRVRDKIAYERESHRMGQEHLKEVSASLPFPKFSVRARMTDADLAQWRRQHGGK